MVDKYSSAKPFWILLIILALAIGIGYYHFYSNSLVTEGKVIAQHQESWNDPANYKSGKVTISNISTVKFTGQKGNSVTFNTSYNPPFHIGETVRIRYNPNHPEEAVISK